jgi:hypothetical protein
MHAANSAPTAIPQAATRGGKPIVAQARKKGPIAASQRNMQAKFPFAGTIRDAGPTASAPVPQYTRPVLYNDASAAYPGMFMVVHIPFHILSSTS